MNELSIVQFLDSSTAIAKQFPTFEACYKYKMLLDVARTIGEKTPERNRADIEAQVVLASNIDAALLAGDVTAEHKGAYQLGKQFIAGAEVDRWRKLRKIPKSQRRAYYNETTKPTRNGLIKWWKAKEIEANVAETVTTEHGDILTDDLAKFDGLRFAAIYADPPWAYSNQSTRAATDNHYGTMSIDDLCQMPVKDLSADECHLHLWTTNAFLREAFDVIDAWGFEYKSTAIWCKPQIGIGNYVRVSHEFVLIAVKGDCKSFKQKNIRSWFEADRTKHSSKPDYWRKVVEDNSPNGLRLELFGRERVPGWHIFGNQISGQMRIT